MDEIVQSAGGRAQIRAGVFETNSSSVHSLVIRGHSLLYRPEAGGILEGQFGEFGWGPETLRSWQERLSYVLTFIQYLVPEGELSAEDRSWEQFQQSTHFRWLREMISDYCGCGLSIEPREDNYCPLGYIDHQSAPYEGDDALLSILPEHERGEEEAFKSKMRDLIFDDRFWIIIDNDNH